MSRADRLFQQLEVAEIGQIADRVYADTPQFRRRLFTDAVHFLDRQQPKMFVDLAFSENRYPHGLFVIRGHLGEKLVRPDPDA